MAVLVPARLQPERRLVARSALPTWTDATLIGAFLPHRPQQRGNGRPTRNARLAAIHSPFRYAAPRALEHAAVISQALAIPPRRRERAIVKPAGAPWPRRLVVGVEQQGRPEEPRPPLRP